MLGKAMKWIKDVALGRKSKIRESKMSDESREALQNAYDRIEELQSDLATVTSPPLVHATVSAAKNQLDPKRFEHNDLVAIMTGQLSGRTGRIIMTQGAAVIDGTVQVMLPDLSRHKLRIGMGGQPREVKLLGKDDGTNVTIIHEGTYYEVHGVFGKKFEPGQMVKVNMKSMQIIDDQGQPGAGDICHVKAVVDKDAVEVEVNGSSRIVLNGNPTKKLEVNDRVQLDQSSSVIIRHLGRVNEENYTLPEDIDVAWDDIGGCQEAKDAMIEAVELPFKHPDIYKFYNMGPPKGVLLYGPPGCGKTMLGKAAAHSVGKSFGKSAMKTGFIYVKGPELLNMWLGNTEQNIRELFHRGRMHYKKHGSPAFLFIDEADALLPMRGSRKTSDADSTIVPMFLSEMDGLIDSHVIVILATNRPGSMDPAAIRDGRIDRHIHVPRPNQATAADVLKLHMKKVPLHKCDVSTAVALAIAELFSKQWSIYKISEKGNARPYIFTMADCVNGAMLKGLVNKARTVALRRDLRSGKNQGTTVEDFKVAVSQTYKGLLDQNPTFDLEDFMDTHKINQCDVQIEKMQAG